MNRTSSRSRRLWWWLIPLLLLTTWLGARSLSTDVIWVDEYHSLQDTGVSYLGPRSPVDIWVKLGERNPWHAPGYFVLLNAWYRLIGPDPAMLRAMSLFLGLLTVSWTYRLGRDVVDPRVGFYAAVVLGASAFFAHFLHEMRVYTLFTLLTVFTTWAYFRCISARRAKWWVWLGLFVGCAALPYAHYYATLPIFAIAMYHVIFVKKDKRWWTIVGIFVLSAILFLPWMSVFLSVFDRTKEFERLAPRALSSTDALVALAHYFSNGAQILFLGLCALAVTARRRAARSILFLTVALLALLLLTNEILQIMHGGRLRYLIAMWPLLSLTVGLGLFRLNQWRPVVASVVLAIWIFFGVWNTVLSDITVGLDGASYTFPLHLAARAVNPFQQPEDVIVNYLPDDDIPAIQYERIAAFYYTPIELEYLMEQTPKSGLGDWLAQMEEHIALLRVRERVWIARVPNETPVTFEEFESALLESHVRCGADFGRPGLHLRLYARTDELCYVGD